jgi:two-component system sensor histidine kinase FlrB
MALAYSATSEHFTSESYINSGLSSVNDLSYNHERTLESEAYPGELAELRQQSNQLTKVIDEMPTGMVMLDGNGIVVKVNKTASLLLDEPILGQAWFDVIRRSFKPRADDWHEVSLKDGRRVKLEISALANQPGQLIMITDLTETRLMQDKISHMQRLSSLGRMVSTLAHQIRTPLSAAMLYSANLSNSRLTPDARTSFQNKLTSRLEDLEQQVNDMLLFAKSGKQQVVEELVIESVIDDAVKEMETLVTKANANTYVTHQFHDTLVLGNKSALTGAIQNLIHNSLQVIKDGAQIYIKTLVNRDVIEIHIKDNGDGIDESFASKIFEPFYTSRVQGTGLGLAVVKSVANAHKGDVSLISSKGEGAHFCIQLPLQNKKQANACNDNNPFGGA